MNIIKHKALLIYSLLVLTVAIVVPVSVVYAGTLCGAGNLPSTAIPHPDPLAVETSIDIGCQNKGNPITDMIFGIIRFLSAGVGLVMVGSIVTAGIQYSASGGDPQATAKAKSRISSTLIALLIFIFSYALLNYLIPGGFLNG